MTWCLVRVSRSENVWRIWWYQPVGMLPLCKLGLHSNAIKSQTNSKHTSASTSFAVGFWCAHSHIKFIIKLVNPKGPSGRLHSLLPYESHVRNDKQCWKTTSTYTFCTSIQYTSVSTGEVRGTTGDYLFNTYPDYFGRKEFYCLGVENHDIMIM